MYSLSRNLPGVDRICGRAIHRNRRRLTIACRPAAFASIIPQPMPLQPGTKLGPYEILEQIGAGGMGEVHKALDTRLNRTVAIKVLPPRFSQSPEMKQRFEREAKTIAALNHPHEPRGRRRWRRQALRFPIGARNRLKAAKATRGPIFSRSAPSFMK
jgi:serine/threonine protein kinase